MKKPLLQLLLLILFFSKTQALILPAENAVVYSTSVYFEESIVPKASSYKLFIFEDSLLNVPVKLNGQKSCSWPAFIAGELGWAKKYFWKIQAFAPDGKLMSDGKTHAFRITAIKSVNFDEVKMRVNKNLTGRNSGGYIFVDNSRCLFNREGKAVWTVPPVTGIVDENAQQVRDFKMTKEGNITFIAERVPLEIDFDGRVIWKAPFPFYYKGDSVFYHHEFRKDNTGNYYVLGGRLLYRKLLLKLPEKEKKNEDMVKITDSAVYRKTEVSMVLKFNKEGKLIWSWDSNDYIQDVDLNYKRNGEGFPNFNSHANAFSIDEKTGILYVGFRDLSRIVQVDMKTGKVLNSYGEKYPSGDAKMANDLFRAQHDAGATGRGTLLIFNNNGARVNTREGRGGISSVIEMRLTPAKPGDILLWQFNLDFDTLTRGKSLKAGNINEMKNGNLLVCAGELNRIFEVTRSKEIVWDAFMFSRGKGDTLWQKQPQYRISYCEQPVFRHHLETHEISNRGGTETKIDFKVYNSGNIPETYIINFIDTNGTVIKVLKTRRLNPKESFSGKTVLLLSLKNSDSLRLNIRPI